MADVRLTAAELALAEAQAAAGRGDPDVAAAFARARRLGAPLRLVARPEALALSDLGRHDAAITAFRPWFEKNRKDAACVNLMGVLLKRAGRLNKALEVLELARRLRPSDLSAWQNIGNVEDLLGRFDRAEAAFRGALRLVPQPGPQSGAQAAVLAGELWRLVGRAQVAQRDEAGAVVSLRRCLALTPGDRPALALCLQAMQRLGQADEARALLARMRAGAPADPDLAVMAARLDYRSGDAGRAQAGLRNVLAAHPQHLGAGLLLAQVLGDGDRRGANQVLRQMVAAHPGSSDALERLIDSLCRSRYTTETGANEASHIEEAWAAARLYPDRFPDRIAEGARALRTIFARVLDEEGMARTGALADLLPHWAAAGQHSSVHYELGQVDSMADRLALVGWHRAWGQRVSAGITPLAAPPRTGGRRLRLGFMSSDLRNHPVSYFALPLLEGYDRDRVEVFAYSFCENPPDAMQTHIAGQVSGFRLWPGRPDAQIADGIRADDLDILFELGGSTAMNRLEVMAHRPARLGASWLGYPHSAGLAQIDYILTDPFIRPTDPRLLIEKPFDMPETWVCLSRMFRPHPITDATPEARKGHFSFGTANNPYKYTPACLDAWAACLRAVPGARFVFLRPEAATAAFRNNAAAAFARRDVDPARLEFIGVRGDHMRHYNEIDVALDSLPHVGGTTTCEALWMGVPTITLVGPGFPERLSYSNLSNAGLGDLAVFSVADYVARAAELAGDPARRLALRHGLRAQIAAHPLGQPDRFVRAFYDRAAGVCA